MRLVEDTKQDHALTNGNGVNGHNGNNNNGNNNNSCDDSDTESEAEEAEPVSATLVLRVVSEPPSPAASRKSSYRSRDQPPSFLADTDSRGPEQFLQVQVQRSTSSGSIPGSRPQSRSRPVSVAAAPSFYITDTEPAPAPAPGAVDRWRHPSGFSSRESSMSPAPSLYTATALAELNTSEMNSTEFMAKIADQTKMIQAGMRTLRAEMDSHMRMLDLGQEAVVLSGLSKHAASSLKNIKNLYDETKYLKSYLEKLEAKVHYDMTVRHSSPRTPPWYRRLLFLAAVVGGAGWAWRRHHPASFEAAVARVGGAAVEAYTAALDFFTSREASRSSVAVTIG